MTTKFQLIKTIRIITIDCDFQFIISCTVFDITCFVMCGSVCVGFVMCGCVYVWVL